MRNIGLSLCVAAAALLVACNSTPHKQLLDQWGFGTNETTNVKLEFKGASLVIPTLTESISGDISVWERFPEVPDADKVAGYVFEFTITPAQTFNPPARITLPDSTNGTGQLVRADAYGEAWTTLAATADAGTLSASTDRATVFAVMAASGGADAGEAIPPGQCPSIAGSCLLTSGPCGDFQAAEAATQQSTCTNAGHAWSTQGCIARGISTGGGCKTVSGGACRVTWYSAADSAIQQPQCENIVKGRWVTP